MNGTVEIVELAGTNCGFRAANFNGCDFGDCGGATVDNDWEMVIDGSSDTLYLERSGAGSQPKGVEYDLSDGNRCGPGPITFTLNTNNACCQNWPSTVTLVDIVCS